MSSFTFDDFLNGDVALSYWDFAYDLPRDVGLGAGFQGATMGAMQNDGPENGTASLFEQFVPPPPTTDEWALSGASQEHGSGLQIMNSLNNGANNGVVSEIESSLPADSGAQQPAASGYAGVEVQDLQPSLAQQSATALYTGFRLTTGEEIERTLPTGIPAPQPTAGANAGAGMQYLFQPEPAQQSAAAHNTGFMATMGQEIENPLPTGFPAQQPAPEPGVGQSAGTIAIGAQENAPLLQSGAVQQSAAFHNAGANMPPLPHPGLAAQPPAVANTGLAPFAGQEMQVAQPSNPSKRKYGVDALAPCELPQEDGRYMVKNPAGKQKNPARKKRPVDPEPGQRRDSVQAEQPVNNQEPTVDTPQSAQRPPNRQGPIPRWPGLIRHHRRRCLNPDAGCDLSCDLSAKFPERYEELRKKPSKKCPHLPPEHQNELWDHLKQ
jgi:hypothetical protein